MAATPAYRCFLPALAAVALSLSPLSAAAEVRRDIDPTPEEVHYDLKRRLPVNGIWDMFRKSRYITFLSKSSGYSEKLVSRAIKSLLDVAFLSIKDKTVYAYTFNYTSTDVDGNPVTLSAKLYIPEEVFSKGLKVRGLILNNCITLTKEDEAPTNAEQVESLMAWKGYAVVMPDGYGFGASKEYPQTFINTQLAGRNNIDCVIAARQLMKDRNIPCEDFLVDAGYSMGGTSGVAALKYACEHPEKGVVFDKAFLGGGAYDFNLCYDLFLSDNYSEAGRFIVLSTVGLNETERLGIDYTKVFKGPLLSNWRELVLSKNYDIYEIMDCIGNPTTVSEYLNENMVNGTGPEYETLIKAASAHNLTTGFTVPDSTEVYILHSTTDNFVPYENFLRLQQSITGKNIHFSSGDYGGHIKSALKIIGLIMKNLK